ncbi:hypothetical protein [Fluviicola sp.]|uniref:hypothetical protein n=1 Tax=Fluviicola sp. TaxID=1917219 RepID=UPI003D29A239
MQENELFQNSEEIANWTYSGATLYYKDCDLKSAVSEKFIPGQILRNGYFLDVSWKGAGIKLNTRFLIASSKAAKLYEVNPANERFGHCCINANSYFKVLDIYKIGDKTQIFLLHIPAKGVKYFRQVQSNIDTDFIQKARDSFDNKINMEPLPELLEPFWLERTNFPVGMDAYDKFYPLDSLTPLQKEAQPLFSGIRNLTGDTSELNVPEPIIFSNPGSDEKGGFWKKIFGK